MNKEKAVEAGLSPAPTSLETMLGEHNYSVKGRSYTLLPIKLKHIPEFKDNGNKVFIPGPDYTDGFMQFIYLQDNAYCECLDKWIQRQLIFNGQPATLEMLMEHDWDIDDLGKFLRDMTRVSG
jgi:hypothetical protein